MSIEPADPGYETIGRVGSPTGRRVGGPADGGDARHRGPARPGIAGPALAWAGILLLGLGHSAMIWQGLGGREGFASPWPPLRIDHGIHYHHGTLARPFFESTGTNSGYDPSFMAGSASSIVSDLSSTLSDLAMAALPGRPALALKLHILLAASLGPWLIAGAAQAWRAGPGGMFAASFGYVVYFWTEFPHLYANIGMLNYLLSVPVGLLALAALARYLDRGGAGRWALAALACSVVFLIHMTSALLVGPAGLLAYGVALIRARRGGPRFPIGRHLGMVLLAPAILAANAFWWLPGWWLRSTLNPGGFAFGHGKQGAAAAWRRLFNVAYSDSPIDAVLLALGVVGLAVAIRRNAVTGWALAGMVGVGFGWGYLAGFAPGLDPLEPGRHTYACYSAACVAAGVGLAEVLARLRAARRGRLDGWAMVGLALLSFRLFAYSMDPMIRRAMYAPEGFLWTPPGPRLLWLVEKVRLHVRPGERLLYEETGIAMEGLPDPFGGQHYSPILPSMAGVEVIGGPYLHATVAANFAQFGEGKLFGDPDWGRDRFVRYAGLYRPAAIACWTPKARAFCRDNPDLIRVVEDDGTILIGRVLGFEGATIRGAATVEAGPNRLVVRDARAGDDGLVVLRYHTSPGLVADPPMAIEPIRLEADPVPFIGLRPTGPGPITLRIRWPPR